MATGGVNPFERAARERKVAKIVQQLDDVAAFCGFNPKRDGFAIANMLASLSPAKWADIASSAEVPEPSPITREEVVQLYRERGELAQRRAS
jgi:hypothetical protein